MHKFQKTEVGFKAHYMYDELELYGVSDPINILYESPSEIMLEGKDKTMHFYIIVKEDEFTVLLDCNGSKEVTYFKHPQQVMKHLLIKQMEVSE